MINQLPPELFAQRPVRSSYPSSKGAFAVTKRRVILIGGLAVILLGSILLVDQIVSSGGSDDSMIPLISASSGPVKERPEQPGGIDIPHRDVAVFEQLEDGKTDESATVEQLLGQGEAPALPDGDAMAPPVEGAVESLDAELGETALPPAVTEAQMDPEQMMQESVQALMESEKAQAAAQEVEQTLTPEQQAVKESVQKAEEAMKIEPPKEVAPVPAVKEAAPKPVAAEVKKEVKKEVKPAVKAPQAPERLPSELFTTGEVPKQVASSTGVMRRMQLGSFKSEDMARAALGKIEKQHGGLLQGVSLDVVRADLGAKGVYYRVVSAPLDSGQAKAICESLQAQKAGCLLIR